MIHLLTGINQYGYKQGLSTLDDIQKLEECIQGSKHGAQILLMGMSKAFDTINRTILWEVLYKKRNTARNHHTNTTSPQTNNAMRKHQVKYGKSQLNNVGVSRCSEISALLFITPYLIWWKTTRRSIARTNSPSEWQYKEPQRQEQSNSLNSYSCKHVTQKQTSQNKTTMGEWRK